MALTLARSKSGVEWLGYSNASLRQIHLFIQSSEKPKPRSAAMVATGARRAVGVAHPNAKPIRFRDQ